MGMLNLDILFWAFFAAYVNEISEEVNPNAAWNCAIGR
jgi:hypothetical protein